MNTQLVMLSRGAEAEIYLVDFFGVKAVLKKRVSKKYRAPLFDELFIKTRTRTEARVLSELYLSGLKVPGVLFVDEDKEYSFWNTLRESGLQRSLKNRNSKN